MSGVKMLKNIFIATSFGVVVAAVELETGFDANDADPAGSIKFVNVKNVTTPGDRSSTDVPEVQYRSDMNPKLFELFESSDEVKIPVWRKNNCACSKVPLFGRLCDDRAGYFVFNLKEKNVPVKWISDKNEVVNGRSLPKKTVNQKTKINPNRDFDDNLPLFFNDVNFTDMEQIQFKITLKNSEEFMIRKNADTAVAELDFNFGTEHGENRAETAKEVVIEMRRWLNGLVPLQTVRRRILAKRNVTQNHGRLLLEREQRRVARENREIVADVQRKNGVKRCVRSWKAARAAVARENRELGAKNTLKRYVRSWKAARAATAAASAEAEAARGAAASTSSGPAPVDQESDRYSSSSDGSASNGSSDSHDIVSGVPGPRLNVELPVTAPSHNSQPQQQPRTIEICSQKFAEKLKAIGNISMSRFEYSEIDEPAFNKYAESNVQQHLNSILRPSGRVRSPAARAAREAAKKDAKEIMLNFGEKLCELEEKTNSENAKFNLIKYQMYKPLFDKCVHRQNEWTAKEEWVSTRTTLYCKEVSVKAGIETLIEKCMKAHKKMKDEQRMRELERETSQYNKFKGEAIGGALDYVLDQGRDLLSLGRLLDGAATWNAAAEREFFEYLAVKHERHPEHALNFLIQQIPEVAETEEEVRNEWRGNPENCTTRYTWARHVTDEFFKKVDGDGNYPGELDAIKRTQFDAIKGMYHDAVQRYETEKQTRLEQNQRAFTEHKTNAKKSAFARLSEKASEPGFGNSLRTYGIATDELMLKRAQAIMEKYILEEYIPKSLGEDTPEEITYRIVQMIRQDRTSYIFDEKVQKEFAVLLAEGEKDDRAPAIKKMFRTAYRDSVAEEITFRMANSTIEILWNRHAEGSEDEKYQRSQLEDLYNRVQNSGEDEREAVKDVMQVLIEKRIRDGEIEKFNLRSNLEQEAVILLFGKSTPATADPVKVATFAWKAVHLVQERFKQAIIAKSNEFPVELPRKTVFRGAAPIAKGTKSCYGNKYAQRETGIPSSTSRLHKAKPLSINPNIIFTQRVVDNTQDGQNVQAGVATPPTLQGEQLLNTAGGAATSTRAES